MKLYNIFIIIFLISSVLISCGTQHYSISRTESFSKKFGCDSVALTFTDGTKQQAKAESIFFKDSTVTYVNGTEGRQFDLSSIAQVHTIRKQSYNGDILGIFLGGMAGFVVTHFGQGSPSESAERTKRIVVPIVGAAIGWLIWYNPRTQYEISVRNSTTSIAPPFHTLFGFSIKW